MVCLASAEDVWRRVSDGYPEILSVFVFVHVVASMAYPTVVVASWFEDLFVIFISLRILWTAVDDQ